MLSPGPPLPLLFLLFLPAALCPPSRPIYSNHWALKVTGGPREAAELAAKYGYVNMGQIGSLDGYYHFYHSKTIKRSALRSRGTHTFLRMDPKVEWVQQQEVKKRVKRHAQAESHFVYFSDLMWPNMWYLHCSDKNHSCRSEMNVLAAWQRGYTGKNVVVTILDDGVEKNHPDLMQNYDPLASYDVNGEDDDPTPRYDATNENKHGTRCAGEVAAYANNSHCIVGIAHNAKIGGIRMLDGDVTDVVEAKSLGIRPDYIDIYSVSWGPDDDGRTVDGPGPLAKAAFEQGIRKGRHGLGSIYVWASGNGGREGDYCSCDGYTNSVYTISVSSTTENGYKPWYLEECASTLATTYSSGAFYERKIVTTDLRQRCTDGHTGTSASAPMVAGIIALALEANPQLTWRDVQHLIVKTSRPAHLRAPDWKINGAGRRVSHLYGFGLVDAEGMVLEASKWKTVPAQHGCTATLDRKHRVIRAAQPLQTTTVTNACVDSFDQHVAYLEHIVVKLTIQHPRRGDLQIYLTSPSGTKSQLLARRAYDHSTEGFKNWEFMTVHCWGEKAAGEWTLEIHDNSLHLRNPEMQGKLKEWTLILYGTAEHPYGTPSPHHSQSTVEESTMDLYASRAALYQSHLELMEEEEDYLGPCHPECGDQGCDGPGADQCLNCVHFSLGSVKTGRKCVSMCPTGFFADTVARRCKRCHKGCETCIGRSHNQCTSCRKGWFLHQEANTCGTVCPTGFYADEGLKHCLKCHQNCKHCIGSAERCVACKDRFSLAGTMCIQECDQGMYLSLVSMKCEACHSTCQTCTGSGKDECIFCAKDFYLHEWRCVPACSDGFYAEEVPGLPHKACRRCEDNCLSCEGWGKTCVQCRDGFSLLNGSCVTNHTCSDADEEFCEMVEYNKLCDRKLFTQFCCRTCLPAG